MMVIDASVWTSYILTKDVNHQISFAWLNTYLVGGMLRFAPTLLLAEVAGAVRRRSGQLALAQQAVDRLDQLTSFNMIPLNYNLGLSAARLAYELQLKGADAVYVAVVQDLRMPLVSWDNEQLNRGASVVPTFTPATAP